MPQLVACEWCRLLLRNRDHERRPSCNAVGDGGAQMTMEVVVLAVSVATLARREDLLAAAHVAAVHLARVHLLQVLLQHEVVAEALLADVAGDRAVGVGDGRTLVAAARGRVVDWRRAVDVLVVVAVVVAVDLVRVGAPRGRAASAGDPLPVRSLHLVFVVPVVRVPRLHLVFVVDPLREFLPHVSSVVQQVGRRRQQLAVKVEVGAVAVAAPLRRKRRVAAVHAALVHQLQVHVLEVRLHAEVVLEQLAALRALPLVLLVQSHVQVVVASDTARLAVVERSVAHVRSVPMTSVAQHIGQMTLRLPTGSVVVITVG